MWKQTEKIFVKIWNCHPTKISLLKCGKREEVLVELWKQIEKVFVEMRKKIIVEMRKLTKKYLL